MDKILSHLGSCIIDHPKHKIIVIEWSIVQPLIKKWSRNRDPDLTRIQELTNYIKNGNYIPPMLHLADLKEEGLVCYDGNHRREALQQANLENYKIIVDLLCHATQSEVFEAFTNINKSVQVPAIFVDEMIQENDIRIKHDIIQLVKKYETQYSSYVSTSSRCHAPNFNRDSFTDMLYNIWKAFDGLITITELENTLDQLNRDYANGKFPKKIKETIVKKCQQNGLWLFREKEINIEHLRYIIDSSKNKIDLIVL